MPNARKCKYILKPVLGRQPEPNKDLETELNLTQKLSAIKSSNISNLSSKKSIKPNKELQKYLEDIP
jgi:hypothetical protein